MKTIPKNAKIHLIKLRSIEDVIYNTTVYLDVEKTFVLALASSKMEPIPSPYMQQVKNVG